MEEASGGSYARRLRLIEGEEDWVNAAHELIACFGNRDEQSGRGEEAKRRGEGSSDGQSVLAGGTWPSSSTTRERSERDCGKQRTLTILTHYKPNAAAFSGM